MRYAAQIARLAVMVKNYQRQASKKELEIHLEEETSDAGSNHGSDSDASAISPRLAAYPDCCGASPRPSASSGVGSGTDSAVGSTVDSNVGSTVALMAHQQPRSGRLQRGQLQPGCNLQPEMLTSQSRRNSLGIIPNLGESLPMAKLPPFSQPQSPIPNLTPT